MMDNDLKIMQVSHVFSDDSYVVPIYQRNYAWKAEQIEQLIEDIDGSIIDPKDDKNYFIGNLIVNQKDHGVYEVIDGQQRLTTLFLLESYLNMPLAKDALRFEAREKSNKTLAMIYKGATSELLEELTSAEITDGYHTIENFFKANNLSTEQIEAKLAKVFLVRVQVPQGIDLNHYFEIMNTRGEQLELHEIVKAKFMEIMPTKHDQKTAALIWDNCANMESYVQMSFTPLVRKKIFTNKWSEMRTEIKDFNSISQFVPEGDVGEEALSLLEILEKNQLHSYKVQEDEDENERFESALSFPNFLLQVSSAINIQKKKESTLDDKYFLDELSWAWSDANQAKSFLYHMLKCRVLFDKYIIKREFAKNYKEIGRWSLQKLEKYRDKNGDKPKYVGTFVSDTQQNNKLIRTLQSCLRITYTSPKTMHWISLVLSKLLEDETCDILQVLENYCKEKVVESKFETRSGFGFERIVFTYLDYILYKNGYYLSDKVNLHKMPEDWQFQFRNSIEHFFPQNPDDKANWKDEDLHGFGNLALITVSGNSKFSNLPPAGKINSYEKLIEQSLKLKVMQKLTKDRGWNEDVTREHGKEMFKILKAELLSNN